MQLQPRLVLAALGLLLAPLASLAQDIELITEAPVTFEVTFNTSVTTTNGLIGTTRSDTTRAYNSTITNTEILKSLLATSDVTGWTLVAVRPAAADMVNVNTGFTLYAINRTLSQTLLISDNQFYISPDYSVANAVTTHSTRNIISSKGKVTNNASLFFIPSFVRKEVAPVLTGPFSEPAPGGGTRTYNISTKTDSAFTLDSLLSTGFSTIDFSTRSPITTSPGVDPVPIFFFALDTIRYTARGDFNGTLLNTVTATKKYTSRGVADVVISSVTDASPTPASGLVSVRMTVGSAKLVPQTTYPAVSY